ncbi:hypothetical protein ACRRTK_002203 [Alexandromys fortis]
MVHLNHLFEIDNNFYFSRNLRNRKKTRTYAPKHLFELNEISLRIVRTEL